jgi:hypothetical protein
LPYQRSTRLPGERASKIGHLDIIKSDLARKLVANFESYASQSNSHISSWERIPSIGTPLKFIFSVDGSFQSAERKKPYRRIGFVKTALLRLDVPAISRIDKKFPHPILVKELLTDSALTHATVFPLQNVSIIGLTNYHAIRKIIFDSIKDPSPPLYSGPMETLKWIVYQKWDGVRKNTTNFECPHCERDVATLPYDFEVGSCPNCNGNLYLTDWFGFHQVMAPDSAPDSVVTDYMNIHETLLLFTGIRLFWENNRDILPQCLFVKDGSLAIRAQYSKLVNPIRNFLQYARDSGYNVNVLGQEKSGKFFEHLELIGPDAPREHFFIPGNLYTKQEIQQRPNTGAPYGKDTNYGAKVFVKYNEYHKMVLNIATGSYIPNAKYSDLIGADNIFATLPALLSYRHEGALLPIELAHGIASLSTYPSAHILTIFADAKGIL